MLFMYEIKRRGQVKTNVRIVINKRYIIKDIAMDVSP